MAKKKRSRADDILDFGKGAIGMSVGSQVLGGIGGTVAEKGQLGMSKMAGFLPATGTIMGAGMTLGAVNQLAKAIPKHPQVYRQSRKKQRKAARRAYKARQDRAAVWD